MSEHPRQPTRTASDAPTPPAPRSGTSKPPKAADFAATRDWPSYFNCMLGKPARETLLRALELVEKDASGGGAAPIAAATPPHAVDLGCGEGRDTLELLNRGWSVHAVDGHPMAIDLLLSRVPAAHRPRLAAEVATFEHARWPECDLLNSSFALPFCPPEHFAGVWARVRDSRSLALSCIGVLDFLDKSPKLGLDRFSKSGRLRSWTKVQRSEAMPDDTKRTPPYISYKTFKTSITSLEHVPHAIDYSLYRTMSGSTRTALFAALRFFNLIDAASAPSDRLKKMASGSEGDWMAGMGELLQQYYTPAQLQAVGGGTVATLKATFSECAPSMIAPACQFLVQAAEDIGLTVSPSIAKGSIGGGGPKKPRAKAPKPAESDADSEAPEASTELITFPVPIPGKATGKITVPKDMDESDLGMFNAMVAAVTAYAKHNSVESQ